MKRVLFLATHIGSGWESLFDILSSHPRIDGFKTNMSYDHYDKIEQLTSNPHKDKRSNSIWMDLLLYNHSFTCKPLLPICNFVYLLREPKGALAEIICSGYDVLGASSYYRYRLRGLCEYAMRSRGYVLMYDRLGDLSGVFNHLGLKGDMTVSLKSLPCIPLGSDRVLEECEQSYEKYLRDLRKEELI